ncbi:hypothetical protein NMQ01_12895 [Janibacter sp. CX7]|uniref:hypothetical protein n=1 Tax=Janibacter sp. CX7 TaxID=2963431 RepID=UPI0020CFDB0C|nr:hypothetical protein [Janibacter sp. CX7]UTT65589.1 hypothetical protein NMQ01_12895 [Janibacter sp. CX7]
MAKRLTARLSAGAALVTGLGLAGIAVSVPANADVTGELAYSCSVPDQGIQFADPWQVAFTLGVDETYEQGAAITAPSITAEVTPGADAHEKMRSLSIKSLEGTADAGYTFGETERSTTLSVAKVDVPETGDVTVVATGTGADEVAPMEDTELDITAGDFTAALTTDTGFVLKVSCTAPADATVGTVTIGNPTTSEPTTSEPTTSEPTTSEPTTSEPTTSEPTTSEPTTSEPTTSEPTTSEPTTSTPAPEVNDWFTEPTSLPITSDGKSFTVKGTADQAGVVTVVLLDGDKKVLRTIEWNVTEGSNTRDFPFAEGTDYVRLVSEDCVDANGNDGSVPGGCNVEYYAPWVNPDSDDDSGDDDGAGTGSSGPETPGVVQTDGFSRVAQPEGDNTAAFLLGGALLAGAGAGSVVLVRRRQAAQH